MFALWKNVCMKKTRCYVGATIWVKKFDTYSYSAGANIMYSKAFAK